MAKQDDYLRITLRLPPDLHENLVNNLGARSLNADIVERLWQSIELGFLGSVTQPPVHVTLDTNGRPTNWPEIAGLAAEIAELFKSPVNALSIEVLTPEIARAHKRREDDFNESGSFPGFTRIEDRE